MAKSNIGLIQEELPSGKIATSSMRVLSFIAIAVLILYLYIGYTLYESHLDMFVSMRKLEIISEQTFTTMYLQTKMYEEWIVLILIAGAFAPKGLQKIIELRAGVTSEPTKNTINIEQK